MTADKQHAHVLLDRIPTDQMTAAVRFLEFLLLSPVDRALATASVEDEEIGEEDEENNYYSLGGDDHADLDEVNEDLADPDA